MELDKLAYVHSDADPAGMHTCHQIGISMMARLDNLSEFIRKVEDIVVTPNAMDQPWSWTQKTRSLHHILSDGEIIDGRNFIGSVFCDWIYIVNLDDMSFEIHSSRLPPATSRYARRSGRNYGVRSYNLYTINGWRDTWYDEILDTDSNHS